MSDSTLTLLQIFQLYRHELGYSFIAALVACFRHWQMRHPFRDIATNGVLCACFAFGMNTGLELFGINGGKWGYLCSVFLGYVGIETVLDVIAEKLPFLSRFTGRRKKQNDATVE